MQEIIHIVTTASRGGAENHLLLLSAEQVLNGKSVSVIFLKGDGNLTSKFASGGVQIIGDIANKNPLLQVYFLRKILRRYPGAIVHSHLPRAELVATLASGRMLRTFTRHNTEPFYPGAPKSISKMLGFFVSYKVKNCIAISHAVKEAIVSNMEVWNHTEVKVVHYGIPVYYREQSSNLTDAVQKKIRTLRKDGILILTCVARLVPQKDFPTLLQGFKLSLEKNANMHLLVAGDGELKLELAEMTSELGILDHVTWLGNVDAPQELMRESDLFLLSSRYEGFGLVLLEAMQAGCPIVAADNSAIPEVLGANYQGLFETGDPQKLSEKITDFTNMEFAKEARKYLFERLPKFGVLEMQKSTSAVYSELASV